MAPAQQRDRQGDEGAPAPSVQAHAGTLLEMRAPLYVLDETGAIREAKEVFVWFSGLSYRLVDVPEGTRTEVYMLGRVSLPAPQRFAWLPPSSETIRQRGAAILICDYAAFDRRKQHGPAVMNRRGYHICQACADAMDAAEVESDRLYKALNDLEMANLRSRELQRKCFL